MRFALLFLLCVFYFNCHSQPQPPRKFGVLVEMGPIFVSDQPDYAPNARRLRVIMMKHFNDFSVGAGFGLDGYYTNNTAPLFIDFRYYGINHVVPFLAIGNAMQLGPEFEHGLMVNGGFMGNVIPKKQWLKLAVGYNYQEVSDVFLRERVTRTGISLGLIFSLWN